MATSFIFLIFLFIGTAIKRVNSEDIYTLQEVNALKQFRQVANDLVQSSYERSDMYLIHWLRAINLDVQGARKLLKQNKMWRQDNQVDDILENQQVLEVAKKYPAKYGFSKDKQGRPGFLASASNWDMRKSVLSGDDWSKHITYHFERMYQLTIAANQSQWLYLSDMHQFNLRQHGCLACVPIHIELVRQYENYYPNHFKVLILFNAPKIFDPTIKLLQSLITPYTRKALKVFGLDKEEWQKEMLLHFDASQLPRALGGTKA